MAVTQTQLEQLYLAYFGRPADADGLAFYTGASTDLWQVAATFSASAESQGLYGPGFDPSVINAIYNNLFGRDADSEGMLFWSTQVLSGRLSAAGAALSILLGARNEDAVTIANKLAAADAFTGALDTSAEVVGYSGQNAAALAREQLGTVTNDRATLDAYLAHLDDYVAAVVAAGGTIGQSLSLTPTPDAIDLSGRAFTIDTVRGIVDPSGAASTYSAGDSIVGNGKTMLDLLVTSAGTTPFAMLEGVKSVHLTADATGTVEFNASLWKGIGSVSLAGGHDGLHVHLADAAATTSLSVANVSGAITASRTDGVHTRIELDGGQGSSIGTVGNAVIGTLGAGAHRVWLGETAQADGVALTIGDVVIAAAGDARATSASVDIMNTANHSCGDMTVGNVALTGAANNHIGIRNWNFGTHEVPANMTVGNVLVTAVADGWATATMWNQGQTTVGDVVVGDVSVSALGGGKAVQIGIANSVSGTAGDMVAGNLTVGNVNLALGPEGTMPNAIINLEASGTGDGNVTVGDLSIGSIDIAFDRSATGTMRILAWALAQSPAPDGFATLGDVNVGAMNFDVGLDASLKLTLSSTAADSSGGVACSVGSVKLGTITARVAIGAQFDLENKSHSYLDSARAQDSTSSTLKGFSIGSITIDDDDGARSAITNDVGTHGTLGTVTLGSHSVTLGVSADASFHGTFIGDSGVDSVTLGDVTADATSRNSVFLDALSVSGTNAAVGPVSVGNISLQAGEGANAQAIADVRGKEVGAVTIGDVATAAVGTNAYVGTNFGAHASGPQGTASLTFGNVTLSANGEHAANAFDAGVDAVGRGGALTVGRLDISVGQSAAKAADAHVDVTLSSNAGPVTVGDVTITASGERAGGDTTMAYDASIQLSSSAPSPSATSRSSAAMARGRTTSPRSPTCWR